MNDNLIFDCIIYDNYKELLKKKVYEPIILKIMNESEIIFLDKYEYISDQSHNESDFVSSTSKYYDAKILFYEKQCQALAINKDHLYTFVIELQKEINEVYEAIKQNNKQRLIQSIFYQEMVNRIKKANEKENIILFVPFACTLEVSDDLQLLLKNDIFSSIFQCILEENPLLVEGHYIYIIYPNCENYIIIKDLTHDIIEFIMDDVLTDYIRFQLKNKKEN